MKSLGIGICVLALLTATAAGQSVPPESGGSAPSPAPGSEPTERERQLQERLDKLERRLAEIESGKTPQGPAPSPPAAPSPSPTPPPEATGTAAEKPEKPKKPEPFAFGDFSWLSGNSRAKSSPFDTKA